MNTTGGWPTTFVLSRRRGVSHRASEVDSYVWFCCVPSERFNKALGLNKVLFRDKTLNGIGAGKIRVAFRRWRRPSVKTGGTLKTAVGLLSIESVEPLNVDEITSREAIEAGHDSLEDLHQELEKREGDHFKIRFRLAGPDPRIELRNQENLSAEDWPGVEKRLGRMDKASKIGPWTLKTLELIETHEGVRAGILRRNSAWRKTNSNSTCGN